MADTITLGELTLLELARRLNNMQVLNVVDVLSKRNEWLLNAVWVQANQPTSHVGSRSIALPAGQHRILNAGVPFEFAKTRQVVEGMAMLESYSQMDLKLLGFAQDQAKFRWQEDKLFLSGLSQTWASTLLYGNIAVKPEEIDGWATRLNALGTMVKDAGGTGTDLTSVYFIQWGEELCHMIYPSNSASLGITVEDLGRVTALDASQNPYEVYRTHFTVDYGFFNHEPKAMGRIANIEKAGSQSIFDPSLAIEILTEMVDDGEGCVMYVNNTVKAQMDKLAMDKSNVFYSIGEEFGRPVTKFRGIPIRRMQSILISESQVT